MFIDGRPEDFEKGKEGGAGEDFNPEFRRGGGYGRGRDGYRRGGEGGGFGRDGPRGSDH